MAVPGACAVEGLGDVVDALPVAAEEEELVGLGGRAGAVQPGEMVLEFLPMGGAGHVLVCLAEGGDQAEGVVHVVEGGWVGFGVILDEVILHRFIFDVCSLRDWHGLAVRACHWAGGGFVDEVESGEGAEEEEGREEDGRPKQSPSHWGLVTGGGRH